MAKIAGEGVEITSRGPRESVRYAWKTYVKCYPHDVYGGRAGGFGEEVEKLRLVGREDTEYTSRKARWDTQGWKYRLVFVDIHFPMTHDDKHVMGA